MYFDVQRNNGGARLVRNIKGKSRWEPKRGGIANGQAADKIRIKVARLIPESYYGCGGWLPGLHIPDNVYKKKGLICLKIGAILGKHKHSRCGQGGSGRDLKIHTRAGRYWDRKRGSDKCQRGKGKHYIKQKVPYYEIE